MSVVPKAPGEPFDYGATRSDGQHERYPVLSEEERARGFVRPVYRAYKHVGLRGIICGERKHSTKPGHDVMCSARPGHEGPCFESTYYELPYAALDLKMDGCGAVTTMGLDLCETYARDPKYYGSTFCVGCRTHLPVGNDGVFVWMETATGTDYMGQPRGGRETTLRVGA